MASCEQFTKKAVIMRKEIKWVPKKIKWVPISLEAFATHHKIRPGVTYSPFAPVGQEFPILAIVVWVTDGGVHISFVSKDDAEDWWEDASLPEELVPKLISILSLLGQPKEQ